MTNSCCCHGAATSLVQVLKDEHRVIEKVLDALERCLAEKRIDKTFFEQALDFFRNFADGCHHAKEENELFPVLESAGVPREGGPIGCMLREHEEGRALLRAIANDLDAAESGDRRAVEAVRGAATVYIAHLRQHIHKEDNVLFVMADQLWCPQEQELMSGAFDRAERSNGNAGKHERYVALADELSRWTTTS